MFSQDEAILDGEDVEAVMAGCDLSKLLITGIQELIK